MEGTSNIVAENKQDKDMLNCLGFLKNFFVITHEKNADAEERIGDLEGHGTPHPSDVLDMPVDPNEPTYCLCHQVSYGEMIGCDNPDCPIEWFHFACVGLTIKPKGKWFCPKCFQDRKKK
uniref:Uncharacterized protein n=1 Tax=Phlebotomus papatasi TaxID=29031 RepID=A0A1B0GPL1_PHLPP